MVSNFQQKFPDRCFDTGIAEEHAVTFAAGLAAAGKRPVCAFYDTFLQRALDEIYHDAALAKLPLIITTNLPLKELTSPASVGYGRIYDRVLEMCHPVKVEGESRRRQKVKDSLADMNEMLGL